MIVEFAADDDDDNDNDSDVIMMIMMIMMTRIIFSKGTTPQIIEMNKYLEDFVQVIQSTKTFHENGNGAFIHSCHQHCDGIFNMFLFVLFLCVRVCVFLISLSLSLSLSLSPH